MGPKNSGGSAMNSLRGQASSGAARSAIYSEAAAARPAPYLFAPTASERAASGRQAIFSGPRTNGTENPFKAAEHGPRPVETLRSHTVGTSGTRPVGTSPATMIPAGSMMHSGRDTRAVTTSMMPEIPVRTPIYTNDAESEYSDDNYVRPDYNWGNNHTATAMDPVTAAATNSATATTASLKTSSTSLSANSASAGTSPTAKIGSAANTAISMVAATPAHLKDIPTAVNVGLTAENWKKYHTAWQDYYQKYYNNYYSNAARQYIAKERLKDARVRAEEEKNAKKIQPEIEEKVANAEMSNRPDSKLRKLVRERASDNAKKTRRLRRFAPLIAGFAVALTILFMQYNRMILAPIMAYVSPGNAPATSIEAVDPTITQTVSADPRLIIPKLNIDVPIRFNVSLDGVMEAMNNGVAHYRIPGASAFPGEIGNFIITGHSAGDVYSANPYKYIFSGLERLQDGDLIYVNYNSVRYTYKVIKREVVEPSNVAALVVTTDKPLLTLVTCTPVGTSRYRLLVTAEQISPAVTGASSEGVVVSEPTVTIDEAVLPANEPTFFENIWNFFTGQ